MGCDIHAYIEYKQYKDRWWSFAKCRLDRNYQVFGKLAGVRGSGNMIEPRGFPLDACSITAGEYYLLIDDDLAAKEVENFVSLADAKQWGRTIEYDNEKPFRTPSPDWHTASYLTLAELQACLSPYAFNEELSYAAVLGAMEALARRGEESRLVFWFDN